MSYSPTTWSTGDTITASAMNKIENGIANAGGDGYDAIISCYKDDNSSSPITYTIEKGTFAEIVSMFTSGEVAPNILVKIKWDLPPKYMVSTNTTMVTYYRSNISVPDIELHVYFYNVNNDFTYLTLIWNANDEITE